MQIWKYPLIHGMNTIEMPVNAEIVRVDKDPTGAPCMWALVSPLDRRHTVRIDAVFTGAELPSDHVRYLGSWHEGAFVYHAVLYPQDNEG